MRYLPQVKYEPIIDPPFRRTNVDKCTVCFTSYPDICTGEIIEYLLPVDKQDIEAAQKVLIDNPSYELKTGSTDYFNKLYDVPDRIIPCSSKCLYFIVRPLSKTEVIQIYENKCLCYPPQEIKSILSKLDKMNIQYYLFRVLVTANIKLYPINHNQIDYLVNSSRVHLPNNHLKIIGEDGRICEDGDYFDVDDWITCQELRKPTIEWDNDFQVLSFDIQDFEGHVQFYIPGIVITNAPPTDPLDVQVNSDGDTKLMYALRCRQYDVAEKFITKQSHSLKNFKGETALDLLQRQVQEAKECLDFEKNFLDLL